MNKNNLLQELLLIKVTTYELFIMLTPLMIFIEHNTVVEYRGKNRNTSSLCFHPNDSKCITTKMNVKL